MANTVLITGANKGIGFEVARQLGRKGWQVLVGARNQQRGLAAVQRLQAEGTNAHWLRIDLDDLTTVHAAAIEVAQKYPQLQLLVNNAGIAGDMKAEPLATKVADLKATLNVNVVGSFAMIKAFTEILARNHGRIANMTIPTKPSRFWHPFSYITSKAALEQMIKMFALSFKRQHIPVEIFGIMPGGVSTDLNDHMQNPFVRPVAEGAGAVVKIVSDKHNHQGKIVTDYGLAPSLKRLVTQHRH
ncbi:SDR family NAD(P)-dependent oxidoreductase [Lacticaseibacillus sp. GG6-2]